MPPETALQSFKLEILPSQCLQTPPKLVGSFLLYSQIVFVIPIQWVPIYQALISDCVLNSVLGLGYTAVSKIDITLSSKVYNLAQNIYQKNLLVLKLDITS